MRRCLPAAIVACVLFGSVSAQSRLAGTWRGDLTIPGGILTLEVAFDGRTTGHLAVPARAIAGIELTDITVDDEGRVRFSVPADRAAFEGMLNSDGHLDGFWLQAGQKLPLRFERVGLYTSGRPPARRDQTPVAPFPYETNDVDVQTTERLACTVTRPRVTSTASIPAAVLLTVAGTNDRDQTHSGHKPYLVLADHLARHGVAAIRCDDRGAGKSSGVLTDASLDDLADDAIALVRYLAALDSIGTVGVIGNSEGALVGSMVAADYADEVGFAVLLGGVGVTGREVIRERLVSQALSSGASREAAQTLLAPFDRLSALVAEAGGVGAEALARDRPALHRQLMDVARTSVSDPMLPPTAEARLQLFAGPWYYSQMTQDGGAILSRVRVPVLAMTGSRDRTNLPEQNLPAIEAALRRAGNTDAEVTLIPDLNHVFQTAVTGGMAEYATLSESFAPVALAMITNWIDARFARR